jgi:carboxymethylenebutenolidase
MKKGIRGRGMVAAVTSLLGLTIWSCTPGGESRASTDESEVAETGYETLAQSDLPSAILGEAPPPRGTDLAYFSGDSDTRGYIAVPEGEGPFPAVILIHEWNGLVDRVRQVADALADEGYVALAADLYSGEVGTSRDENMVLVRRTQADPETFISNLDSAVQYLRNRNDVTGKVGTVGWCFGGGMALSYGLGGTNHDATAIFYGSLVTDPEELRSLTHEVYGTFAALDSGIPIDQVNTFIESLRTVGVSNDIHIYDDVNHGFWLRVEGDPDARTTPAADAWRRLKDYFDRTLR